MLYPSPCFAALISVILQVVLAGIILILALVYGSVLSCEDIFPDLWIILGLTRCIADAVSLYSMSLASYVWFRLRQLFVTLVLLQSQQFLLVAWSLVTDFTALEL